MKKIETKGITDPVVLRILNKLIENGQTQRELVDYLRLGNGIFTRWKYENVKTYMIYIDDIAHFLGVTSSYLLYGTEQPDNPSFTEDEMKILTNYRLLPEDRKKLFIKVTEAFVNA